MIECQTESSLSWELYFKEICQITAKRSSCQRLRVGCILVKENRIISLGYNGFLPGFPHNSIIKDGHEVATIHAEQNTIIDCARRGVSCHNSEAYITHYPCITCTKLLLASGIKKIHYINDYNNDPIVNEFLETGGIEIKKI
jgi:dCMP deaminase